ncbi:MAG: hypothetical protein ACXWUB_11575 [Burkholderiales bacterium]
MERRFFLRLCAASASLASLPATPAGTLTPRSYTRSRLYDDRNEPLLASRLEVGRNYIFHDPFEGTPCFLINLGQTTGQNVALRTEQGDAYRWPGGVGPRQAIVAYSAICSHLMTYPTRQVSFISYRDGGSATAVSRANTIHCCSEHSEYDPASGARVLKGPAPQPLAAIILEYEPATSKGEFDENQPPAGLGTPADRSLCLHDGFRGADGQGDATTGERLERERRAHIHADRAESRSGHRRSDWAQRGCQGVSHP